MLEPKLIPASSDPSATQWSRKFEDYQFDALKPYLGEFRVKFSGDAGYDDETNLWFHVTGFKGPDFPSVYSLPSDDVPLLRLHRPPGDQSQAFLQRSWASSVEIGFAREDGDAVRFNQDLRSKFGASVGGELCTGAAVGGELCC